MGEKVRYLHSNMVLATYGLPKNSVMTIYL